MSANPAFIAGFTYTTNGAEMFQTICKPTTEVEAKAAAFDMVQKFAEAEAFDEIATVEVREVTI